MKLLALWAFVFATAFLPACMEVGNCLTGEGQEETRTLQLDTFSEVAVHGSMRVFISEGSPQRVEVKGQPNVLDELETKVEGSAWDIAYARCIRDHKPIEVYITVPELRAAHVGGSGYVELRDEFSPEEFEASVSGSGDMKLRLDTRQLRSSVSGSGTITAEGVAYQHDLSISGSGNNNSFALDSREVAAEISGSGKAQLNVRHKLEARISGSGRVFYKGSPQVNTDVSGSGRVEKQ